MGISIENETYSHYYLLNKADQHIFDMKNGIGNSSRVPVLLKKDYIKIGCAKVDIDAIQFILDKHKEKFGNDSFVI